VNFFVFNSADVVAMNVDSFLSDVDLIIKDILLPGISGIGGIL